ncbi:MAG TPA: hypothetical protein VFC19_34750 [Candidatus Limnocylindrales bacterium]|nr:hypothetical protein [Candidatus Limnocylindrales bacterium]
MSVRRGVDTAGFVAGLFLGGVATAMALVVLGSLVRAPIPAPARPWLVAVAAAALLAREIGLLRFKVPQNARQVPQFVTRVPFWGAMQFGTEMGTGMRTYSPTGLPHVVALGLLLTAGWSDALLAGLGFAAGRALMTLTFLSVPDREEAGQAFLTRIAQLRWLFAGLTLAGVASILTGG